MKKIAIFFSSSLAGIFYINVSLLKKTFVTIEQNIRGLSDHMLFHSNFPFKPFHPNLSD